MSFCILHGLLSQRDSITYHKMGQVCQMPTGVEQGRASTAQSHRELAHLFCMSYRSVAAVASAPEGPWLRDLPAVASSASESGSSANASTSSPCSSGCWMASHRAGFPCKPLQCLSIPGSRTAAAQAYEGLLVPGRCHISCLLSVLGHSTSEASRRQMHAWRGERKQAGEDMQRVKTCEMGLQILGICCGYDELL